MQALGGASLLPQPGAAAAAPPASSRLPASSLFTQPRCPSCRVAAAPTGGAAAAAAAAPRRLQLQRQHWQPRRRPLPQPLRSVWDDSVTLADLRQRLEDAVAQEDYAAAAKIRDELQQRQTDATLAIEDANTRFYDAFRSGNVKEMQAIWGQGDHVQVMHPGAACIAGRDMVIESWGTILRGVRPGAFKLSLQDVRVYALSETHGLVTCLELIDADESTGRTVATNLFELQDGKWVITLHQGGPLISASRFR